VKQIAKKGQTNQSLFHLYAANRQFTGGKPSSFQLTIFAHTHWFKLSRMVHQKKNADNWQKKQLSHTD
jgi:hypothetical protein